MNNKFFTRRNGDFYETENTKIQIDRINALYRKSQAEGLTEAEKEEQAMLRKAYVADVKRNLVAQLNNIDMQNPDGTVTNLGEEYGNKKKLS